MPEFVMKAKVSPPSVDDVKPQPEAATGRLRLTFYQAFGVLGVPLLALLLISITWTTWLIWLTLAPNQAANFLMHTGDYDNGQFWLIVERGAVIKWLSTAGFVLVDACYVVVLVKVLAFRRLAARTSEGKDESRASRAFDFVAAVLYPIGVLGYCYSHFNFDRAVYLVNAEVLADGNFERFARMLADPAEVALFLLNFDSLRIQGALDFTLIIGMNLSFCYRFSRVAS
ncbi:hypothetical protein BBJ28_00015638, partial [Nothophytophthora sp. Chile5]